MLNVKQSVTYVCNNLFWLRTGSILIHEPSLIIINGMNAFAMCRVEKGSVHVERLINETINAD